MSHISNGEPLTSREINLIAALDALAPSTTQAIQKNGSTSFQNISVGGTPGIEIPGGPIDGHNTVFTVNNPPIWIEVGGQTMVSQAQDATNYGYTVSGNAAPYTVTFLTAPQPGGGSITPQTPHSFHN